MQDICLAEAAAASDSVFLGAVYKYTITYSLTHNHTTRMENSLEQIPGDRKISSTSHAV